MPRIRPRLVRILPILLALVPLPAPAAAQVAPDERWFTIETEHFAVHYTQGLEPLARRAAERAETARAQLAAALVEPPRGRIHLLVADNVDYPNGFATPLPRNRVVIYAHPPVDDPSLAFFEEWAQLVITHELAHIVHLDHASGTLKDLRSVFGRHPLLFPGVGAPQWMLEGLATHLESRLTQAGRVRGTQHEMALRTAILEDAFFSIGRASGNPVSWPGGTTPYVYGAHFLTFLAERYGPDAPARLVRTIGSRVVPFQTRRNARAGLGTTFTRAWAEWRDSLRTRYTALADTLRAAGLTEPDLLTREGRSTAYPRYSPDGRSIAYAASTSRDDPSTRILREDGRVEIAAPRTTLGPAAWLPGGAALLTAWVDATDPYRHHSDLYVVGAEGGVRRLTRAARLAEVDVRRGDGRVVAVRAVGGGGALVLAGAEGDGLRELTRPSLDEAWSLPRWSPRGDRIAAARWRAGGYLDVVVLDTAGAVVRELTRDRAVDHAPAWSPDGRWVVFSSDRSGIPNLYAYDLETGALRQVTSLLTGAAEPDVSPDGRWIAFAWYRADGWHLARVPFDPASWRDPAPLRAEVAGPAPDPARFQRTAGGEAKPYSPWPTLRPAYWSPLFPSQEGLGAGFGAEVTGSDVVERHAYTANAALYPGGRADALLAYVYRGLGIPQLGGTAFQQWDVAAPAEVIAGPEGPIETELIQRERSVSLVATVPWPRFRTYSWVSAGLNLREIRREWADPDESQGVAARDVPPEAGAALTFGRSSQRGYGYSISAEEGWLVTGTVEGRRYLRAREGEDRVTGYFRTGGRAQAFHPFRGAGFARHVLAGRVMAAADWGSRSPNYSVGGLYASGMGSPLSTSAGLGGRPDLPVRGYAEGTQTGDRAAAASLEYRFPLLLVERGRGTLPFYVDRFWGTVFADAGAAWCDEVCPAALPGEQRPFDPIYSVGAELGGGFTLFYHGRFDLMGGVAMPLTELRDALGDVIRPRPELYLRFGRSF